MDSGNDTPNSERKGSCQKSEEEKARKRTKDWERQARSRSLMSEEERERIGAKNRVMMSGRRAFMTEEEKEESNAKNKEQKLRKKYLLTDKEKEDLKAKNRERKARSRSLKTDAEKDAIRAKNREQQERSRSLKTDEEKDNIKIKEKEKKARIRSRMTEDQKEDMKAADRNRKLRVVGNQKKTFYMENEREFNRLYKVRVRGQMTDEEIEFDRIELLLRMRKHRQSRNGKEHLLDKLQAIRGMRLFREDGRLVQFSERFSYCKFKRNGLDLEEFL